MGCDYYIQVYLEIEHKYGVSYYTLPIIRAYYSDLDCGIYDSDDDEKDYYCYSEEFKNLYKKMRNLCLTPRKPVVIYENNSFTSQKFETKYLPLIQNKIDNHSIEKYPLIDEDTGVFASLEQVIRITKKEERYER